MASFDFVIVGLGNPGKEYENSRHNMGFRFIDQYTDATFKMSKFNALTADVTISGKRCLLVKPQTYMNNSGIAVAQILNYYDLSLDKLIVIYDDISFAVGEFKIKTDGSSGGHNGIKSLIEHLHSQDFKRIKIGVGKDKNRELKDWVLADLSKAQLKTIDDMLIDVSRAVDMIISSSVSDAMCNFNKKSSNK